MAIETLKMIIKNLKANIVIQENIAKDLNGNLSIKIKDTPVGMVLPGITVGVVEKGSERIFPTSYYTATITVWVNPKFTREDYAFRKTIIDAIIPIFNREGKDLSELDEDFRLILMKKESVSYGHSDEIDRNYGEVIFNVIKSQNESFEEEDRGDKPWA